MKFTVYVSANQGRGEDSYNSYRTAISITIAHLQGVLNLTCTHGGRKLIIISYTPKGVPDYIKFEKEHNTQRWLKSFQYTFKGQPYTL